MKLMGHTLPKILECKHFVLSREQEGDTSRPRLTKHFELDFDVIGNRHLTLDGKEYVTEPGSIIFRHPGQYCTSSGGYDMYILTFEWIEEDVETLRNHSRPYTRNAPQIYNRSQFSEEILSIPHSFVPEHGAEILSIYKRLAVIYKQQTRQTLIDMQLSRLLYLVCADAMNHSLEQQEEYTPIDKVLSYINTHYMENITLEDLASHVHLSRHYLVHLFRSETGKTPFEFITSTRLEQAKRLLACTNLSIAEIASQCGFESSSYFCRRFRTAFGMTPRSFKKEKSS